MAALTALASAPCKLPGSTINEAATDLNSLRKVADVVRKMEIRAEVFPIAGSFTISRGARTHAHVVRVILKEDSHTAQGECVPYPRYDESVESVTAQIEAARSAIESSCDREELQEIMPAGAARNAVDCALWDLEAKKTGKTAAEIAGLAPLKPAITAFTISLGDPEKMRSDAQKAANRALLKVKLGGDGDAERIAAVREGAPDSTLILDANEAWREALFEPLMAAAAKAGAKLVEQPLPAGEDEILRTAARPVPVCADESLHTRGELAMLRERYDCVNIKLDKAGGLTEALALQREARKLGFQIMTGCMVGTSLGMAPAMLIAQDAEFVDLDGPLLLAEDREPPIEFPDSSIMPPPRALWG